MKLKVGDIEMDSHQGISFGESAAPLRGSGEQLPQGQGAQDGREVEKTSLASRLPGWSRRAYLLAGLALGLAAMGLGLVAASLVEVGSALRFLPLVPVPGLLLASGMALWRAGFSAQRNYPPVNALDETRSDKIAGHLAERVEPASVEELIAELGWREQAVVAGLDAGVSSDLIVEDLDLDTGHWVYAAAADTIADAPRQALPIADRAKRLTSDDSQ